MRNLEQVRQAMNKQPDGPLNVYKHNNIGLLTDCVGKVSALQTRVDELLELFPENHVLHGVKSMVGELMSSTASHPQMYFSSQLEKLLCKCMF